MQPLPQLFHFIWLGGRLPQYYYSSLTHIAALATKQLKGEAPKHHPFKVKLWVDNINHFEAARNAADYHSNNIEVHNIEEVFSRADPRLYPAHTNAPTMSSFEYFCRLELVGAKNFAAASDMLRYEILRQEGGYYFDFDDLICLLDRTLKMTKKHSDVTGSSFIPDEVSAEYGGFKKIDIRGNSSLASIPDGILIRKICEKMMENCTDEIDNASQPPNPFSSQMDRRRRLNNTHPHKDGSFIADTERAWATIRRTGPAMLHAILTSENLPNASRCHNPIKCELPLELLFDDTIAGCLTPFGCAPSDVTWIARKGSFYPDFEPYLPRSYDDRALRSSDNRQAFFSPPKDDPVFYTAAERVFNSTK